MGRPERPIDPEDQSTTACFARDLRQLRQHADNPTYGKLAKQTGFSDTTLSAALSGRGRPPTLDVVLALVPVLGGDSDVWRDRWVATFGDLAEPAVISLGGVTAPQSIPEQKAGPEQLPVTDVEVPLAGKRLNDEDDGAGSWSRRQLVWGFVVGAVVLAGIVVGVGVWWFGWFTRPTSDDLSRLYARDSAQVEMRECPMAACMALARWNTGTHVRMVCFHDSETVTFNYRSNRWFNVYEPQTGQAGWVHSSQVSGQTQVGAC